MSAIIHKFNNPSHGANEQHKQLLEQIARCLNEELSELIGRMFDGADDMLFQQAENASSNEDQNQYFDTMRMLRTERKNIVQNFAASLKTHLQPTSKQPIEEAQLEDELSLVDQDEMEEMVAISAMQSKAMSVYGEAVNHLEARIEFLSMKTASTLDKDSLAPKNICESFRDAMSEIELTTNSKLMLYKLFDQEVILNLAPLYDKLNQLFIDQGILPQIKHSTPTVKKSSQTNNQAPTPSPAPVSENTDAVYTENPTCDPMQSSSFNHSHGGTQAGHTSSTAAAAGMHQEINRVVSQFIQGELTASGPGIPASFTTKGNSPSSAGTQYYDRREVMKALSNLQYSTAHSSAAETQVNAEEFKRALLADMGSRSGGAVTKQVSHIDEKTIDFIEMLFDAIVEDNSISEPVTNLLLRLQIPVIKVAMLDKNFFEDNEHPCKTTLNLIAHLGRGLSSREDELFTSLDVVVDNLLNDFDVDIISFENASSHLQNIEQEELYKAAEKEKETQKTVLQKHAREMVLAELQYHAMNKALPKPAQKLILKHWSTLMFHRYIRFGKNSDSWSEATAIARRFIHSLQPIESSQAYYNLLSEKDELIDIIHSNLLETRQNPVEIEAEINNTFLAFEEMLENSAFNPKNITDEQTYFISVEDESDEMDGSAELDAMPEPVIDFEEETVDPLQQQAQIAREKIAALPSDVRPGVWFEVFNGEDSPVRRAKLSVIIMEEAKLVFVDRVGVKVLEKDAEDFSNELNTENSKILADHSAFDHALGLVINSLSSANK